MNFLENIEELFVKTFIKVNLQSRVLYELRNKQKREKAFCRFSHISGQVFQANKIVLKSEKLLLEEVTNHIKFDLEKTYCYFMDMDGGNLMPGSEALDKSYNSYLTSIVIFNKQYIFIKTEMDVGGAMKILLKDDAFQWDSLCR